MKKSLLFTFLVGMFTISCAIAQQTANSSSGGTGWKRIAAVQGAAGRGFGRIILYTIGGSWIPIMSSINWFHDWTTGAGISVYSDSKSSPFWSEFRITDDGTNSYIEVNFIVDVAALRLILDDAGWGAVILYANVLPDGGGNVRATAGAGRLNVENNFIVANNGNIGIGTVNPTAKLAVNGNILAKEIKVKTDISVPDYIFSDDYKLSPLKDLETYVKKHKHLPEIPSATDIHKDGLNLAEMNLMLLKKIEELTLYIIEQQKDLDRLNEKTKNL